MAVSGILLAAGAGTRFGGHKLLYPLADGTPVGVAAARNLHRGVERVVAVIRPGDDELSRLLAAEGALIVTCRDANEGMGKSLACGVRATRDASGWLIALADMPWVRPDTVQALARLIQQGAALAAPCYRGRRGHPVGFGRDFRDALIKLEGDTGARSLLVRHADCLQWLPCDDPGTLRDIDTRRDLDAVQAVPAAN